MYTCEEQDIVSLVDSICEVLMDEDNLHQLENAIIDALSPMEKRVLQLFLKGLDYMEIAKAMDKKPKAIDNALQRAIGCWGG